MRCDSETVGHLSRWDMLRETLAELQPVALWRALTEADIRICLMAADAAEREDARH